MTAGLSVPPLFAALAPAQRVLIAGAGGGFDVYAGLPLALALAGQGKEIVLANLSFSDLSELAQQEWMAPGLALVDAESRGRSDYFPERTLVRWLRSENLDWRLYAIERAGVVPVAACYRELIQRHDLDALVLVDGGTDILLRGDESGLGTPEEDAVSLVAASEQHVEVRIVVSLGFGIDAFHGVASTDVLAALAALNRRGAYLGALSIPRDTAEGTAYLDAVRHAALHNRGRPSIVNGQIAAAISGDFGDVAVAGDPATGGLFVNPLMAIYFSVRLDELAARSLYGDQLRSTRTVAEVSRILEEHRSRLTPAAPLPFPH